MLTLVVLTIQGWTGDFVNLFSTYPTTPVTFSVGGLLSALAGVSDLAVYHALEGAFLVILSVLVLALSFRASKARSVRIASFVAMAAVISAAIGGILFTYSSFQSSPNSAQMGGSFIGAYAFYFLELYYTK